MHISKTCCYLIWLYIQNTFSFFGFIDIIIILNNAKIIHLRVYGSNTSNTPYHIKIIQLYTLEIIWQYYNSVECMLEILPSEQRDYFYIYFYSKEYFL